MERFLARKSGQVLVSETHLTQVSEAGPKLESAPEASLMFMFHPGRVTTGRPPQRESTAVV